MSAKRRQREQEAIADLMPHPYRTAGGAPCEVCGADWKNPIHEVQS